MEAGLIVRDFSLKTKRTLTLFILLALTGGLVPCAGTGSPKFRVLTTIFPLWEFARAVADDRGDIGLILPPGAEVHTWQPRVSDIKKFSGLDAFIYIGGNLEPWANDILRSAARPGLKILEAGKGLIASAPGGPEPGQEGEDPHVWLDLGSDQIIVDRILAVLKGLASSDARTFTEGAEAYKERLRLLDEKYRNSLRNCDRKTFIVAGHAAFGYLARRYGLEQIAVSGTSPDAAPTPRRLVEIISLAKEKNIKTIFYEPNTGDKLARMIAAEAGADVRPLSAAHNLTPDQVRSKVTFFDLMEQNLENLKYGLGCR
jgi:zinc transport system substrate-binding protein